MSNYVIDSMNDEAARIEYGLTYIDPTFGELTLGRRTGEQDNGFDIYEVWINRKKHFWNSHAVSVIGRWTN